MVGGANQNLMQGCMEQTFKKADQLLGFNSRYKPEISYDMTQTPPLPFMHREDGQDTTEPSHYWQGRAGQEIDNYAARLGMVRRPDLVIVDDPCKPPSQDNIERVVEIKFRGDRRDGEQDNAYRRISGNDDNYSIFRIGAPAESDEQGCDCGQQTQPEPVPVPATEKAKQSTWGAAGSALGWSAVTALGVAALILFPPDAPIDEPATAAAAVHAASAWKAFSAAF